MIVEIQRFAYPDWGTFGDLILPSGMNLATVERPWLENKPRISCIPNGSYLCEKRRYNRGGYDAVEVLSVEGRTHILFHRGNYVHESAGCILVNSRHGALGHEWCGVDSGSAFEAFMNECPNEFQLIISDKPGANI